MSGTPVDAKKIVSSTLDNMITRFRSHLLSKNDLTNLKTFDQICERMARKISGDRGKDSPEKRVFPVQIYAQYKVLSNLLNPQTLTSPEEILNHSQDEVRLWGLGSKFSDVVENLFETEYPIFEKLSVKDMEKGIYLGVNIRAEKS